MPVKFIGLLSSVISISALCASPSWSDDTQPATDAGTAQTQSTTTSQTAAPATTKVTTGTKTTTRTAPAPTQTRVTQTRTHHSAGLALPHRHNTVINSNTVNTPSGSASSTSVTRQN